MIVLLLACAPDPADPAGGLSGEEAAAPLVDIAITGTTGAEIAPGTRHTGRDRKRMDVDQLSAAIAQATGGIHWTEGDALTGDPMFEALSATLGKPDYALSTQEDRSPSVIFAKFLGDAAASVCTKLIEHERTLEPGTGTFLALAGPSDTHESDPTAIAANIQLQLLRFHGRELSSDDPELEEWVWLWRTVHSRTGDTSAAWRATCAGLIMHPEFYTY